MKFTRNGSVQLVAGVIAGASAIVIACSGDDGTGTTTDTDAGASSSGGSSGGSSGTTTSSGGSSGGSSGAPTDGGVTDSASDSGPKKAGGEGPCTTGAECLSGKCFVGKQESYCSIECTMKKQDDPVCEVDGGPFSGKCNSEGFCQKK